MLWEEGWRDGQRQLKKNKTKKLGDEKEGRGMGGKEGGGEGVRG